MAPAAGPRGRDGAGRSAELMRELVLDPLADVLERLRAASSARAPREAATAHRSDGSAVPGRWHVYPELAAAGLWTTPGDLARYAIAVQRAYRGAPDAILGAELARQMLTPADRLDAARSGGLELPRRSGSVLGGRPEAERLRPQRRRTKAFKCHLLAHRDAGCGAAVMTNGDEAHALDPGALRRSRARARMARLRGGRAACRRGVRRGARRLLRRLRARTGCDDPRCSSSTVTTLCVRAPGQPDVRFVRVAESEFGSFAPRRHAEVHPDGGSARDRADPLPERRRARAAASRLRRRDGLYT